MRHLVPFTKDQLSTIKTSLWASTKYSDAQSKILDELTDKFFDVKGIKELYDILMEEVYGDGGIKGY